VVGSRPSCVEAVNEFTHRMKDTLEEAKSALAKAKDDMAQYYNHCCSPALSFSSGDMVYLDSEDIQTTCPSKKLSHCRLGPYTVAVLFDAPQIPAGIQSFQWIPLEWDWNLEKIHRNETESSGMEPESTGMGPESTGMAGIHRNDRIPQE